MFFNICSDSFTMFGIGSVSYTHLDVYKRQVYVEVSKLIRLILTFPVTMDPSERSTSTLTRIKNYLRNTMINISLNSLRLNIAIEKQFVEELMSDQLFKYRIVDNFASKKKKTVLNTLQKI